MTHATMKNNPKTSALMIGVGAIGAVFGIWAFTAFFSLLSEMGWSVTEVIRQYMVATGAIGEYETLVDYYTHIKGFEYIIAVAFLGLYPAYFKYVNRTKAPMKA
ncbi:MAG: hypothetical protein M8357_07335 [Desulfobulbaceae bacterium]|nr:hypothetical protein [Desulfobulbaceae bacterium]